MQESHFLGGKLVKSNKFTLRYSPATVVLNFPKYLRLAKLCDFIKVSNFSRGGIGQEGNFSDHNFPKFYGGGNAWRTKKILEGDVGR